MTHYEQSLVAMKRLLDAVDESQWADWIAKDIAHWQSRQDTSHHLSAYGGMGSFTDVVLCGVNGHAVTEAQEPWANTLFLELQSLCGALARDPERTISDTIECRNSVLVAIARDEYTPPSDNGHERPERTIQGWRCLRCGFAETPPVNIEHFIAQDVLPAMAYTSCERSDLDDLVDRVLACDVPGLEAMRQFVSSAAKVSGISVVKREGWMRPCPSCGKDDTAVYRWRLIADESIRFEPSDDNLPMRT